VTGPAGRCVVAIDVGGTTLKGALCDGDGSVFHRERRRTGRDEAAVVDGIVGLAESLAGEGRGRLGGDAVAAIGLAVPGFVDEARGIAVRAVNLPWRELPLGDAVAARTGLPVALGHDVRAAAAAEAALGSGADGGDFVFVAIGTGIGAALVLGGEARTGAHGRAGELGHTVVDPAGPPCACGGRGHLEAIASAAAIERAYADTGAGDGASAREIAALATAGDPAASAVWSRAVEALADALTGAVALLDPDRIVIGGGLAEAGAALLHPLAAELEARATLGPAPPVAAAALGAEAGCLGAALLAWRSTAVAAGRRAPAPGMMGPG
jgi:glucokinase